MYDYADALGSDLCRFYFPRDSDLLKISKRSRGTCAIQQFFSKSSPNSSHFATKFQVNFLPFIGFKIA